jgi:hypothetical protein
MNKIAAAPVDQMDDLFYEQVIIIIIIIIILIIHIY